MKERGYNSLDHIRWQCNTAAFITSFQMNIGPLSEVATTLAYLVLYKTPIERVETFYYQILAAMNFVLQLIHKPLLRVELQQFQIESAEICV